MDILQIARVCHEANRAYCETLGDFSQVPFNDAPTWQVDSACEGVKYLIEHPLASPGVLHEEWAKSKIIDGWKYGETKDAKAKTHPCLVPFAKLPPEQQAKDLLFSAVVNALRDRLDKV